MARAISVATLRLDERKGQRMPKMSKQSASAQQFPDATEWAADLGGYKAGLVSITVDADLTPLLQGLPNDQCQCPHWGYVFKGSMWFDYGEGRREVFEAGSAFYVPAGHTAGAAADSEFLVFSPTEIIAEVEAHMAKRAQELQNA